VASQVVAGLGFLGGGAIIVLGRRIRGLTTAASIWVTAAIGLAVGAGYVVPALATWAVVIFALWSLVRLEKHMAQHDEYVTLRLEFSKPGRLFARIEDVLRGHGFSVLTYKTDRDANAAVYHVSARHSTEVDFEQVTSDLSDTFAPQGLTRIRWK